MRRCCWNPRRSGRGECQVHILISIPPKHSVSQVVGFIKGKSAIQIARNFQGKKRIVWQHFWARGYYAPTVSQDEEAVREYIQKQEKEDKRIDQPKLFLLSALDESWFSTALSSSEAFKPPTLPVVHDCISMGHGRSCRRHCLFISRRAWQIYYVGVTNIEIRMGTSVQDETLLYLLQKVLKHVENTNWSTKVL
jgi:hypothetical protein